MSNSNENKTKKVVKIVLNVLLWIFLVFAFLMMVVAFTSRVNDYNVPMVSNKIVLTVESDSMSPTFNKGDMLIGTVLSNEEKAELKAAGVNVKDKEAVKAYFAEKEEKAKAEAEEKAKAERLANPTTEDLLKDIKALLEKQVK